MAAPSDNSFIPKRGPAKRKRKVITRQVYIFTYISYILMFATLLATGGVFLYGQYVNQQLNNEIASLNSEIGSFDQAEMERVVEFDTRLQQANGRLENSVSVVSIFSALEAATIDTVEIESLTLNREFDDAYTLAAEILTDSFDSTIFQRNEYESNPTFPAVTVNNVQTGLSANEEGGEVAPLPVVTFDARLQVPLDRVPYQPAANSVNTPSAPSSAPSPDPVSTSTTATGTTPTEPVNEPTS